MPEGADAEDLGLGFCEERGLRFDNLQRARGQINPDDALDDEQYAEQLTSLTANICECRPTHTLACSIARGGHSGASTKLRSGTSSSQSMTRSNPTTQQHGCRR
jgi:hypothetical protein